MSTLREIRKKIKATKSIQKTTKAMQMIASSRFQKAQHQIISARPYAFKIQHLLSDMLKKTVSSPSAHPFLARGSSVKEGLLVVTSEKGLCGSYNTNIMKKSFEYIKSKKISDLEIFIIGKKGRDYFKRNGIVIQHEYFNIFKNFSSAKAEIIADEMANAFRHLKLRRFDVIYSQYLSLFNHPVVINQILPVKSTAKESSAETKSQFGFDYIYEPSKKDITDKLLSRYLKSEIFRILIEAYTSEIAARRNSMENANKNSTEIISELSLVMNKLRQQQITTELTEIIGANG